MPKIFPSKQKPSLNCTNLTQRVQRIENLHEIQKKGDRRYDGEIISLQRKSLYEAKEKVENSYP